MTVEQRLYNQLNTYKDYNPDCSYPLCDYALFSDFDEIRMFAKLVSKNLGDYYDSKGENGEDRYLLSIQTRKKVVTYALQYLKEKGCVD